MLIMATLLTAGPLAEHSWAQRTWKHILTTTMSGVLIRAEESIKKNISGSSDVPLVVSIILANTDGRQSCRSSGALLKSCSAAFLMAQQGELSRVRDKMAMAGANWRTAAPRPAPRTRACNVCTAHTCKGNHMTSSVLVATNTSISVLLLRLQTCGRSRVWSQFSGRGLLAVSSNVCILWVNRGLALLASSADKMHRMSIGNPAARRVTDVERGDCTTLSPYEDSRGTTSVNQPSSTSIQSGKSVAYLFQHVCWNIPYLSITTAQQRSTELGESNTAPLHCPLVKRKSFFQRRARRLIQTVCLLAKLTQWRHLRRISLNTFAALTRSSFVRGHSLGLDSVRTLSTNKPKNMPISWPGHTNANNRDTHSANILHSEMWHLLQCWAN